MCYGCGGGGSGMGTNVGGVYIYWVHMCGCWGDVCMYMCVCMCLCGCVVECGCVFIVTGRVMWVSLVGVGTGVCVLGAVGVCFQISMLGVCRRPDVCVCVCSFIIVILQDCIKLVVYCFCVYLPSCSIQDLTYTRGVLSPYLYLSSFSFS